MKTWLILAALLAAGIAFPAASATSCPLPSLSPPHATCYVDAGDATVGCHTNDPATSPPSFPGGACAVLLDGRAIAAAGFNEWRPGAGGWCTYVVLAVVSAIQPVYDECEGYTPEPWTPLA